MELCTKLSALTVTFFFCCSLAIAESNRENGLNKDSTLTCPKDWIDATGEGMGCLLFNSTTRMTWIEAQQFCSQNNDSHLVEIFSQGHQDFLLVELNSLELNVGKQYWWIGLTNIGNIASNDWYWVHSHMNASFTSWRSGSPGNGYKYNFAFMHSRYEYNWYDSPATSNFYPICQFFP